MPQITVDYSASLESSFDRRAFALALHPLIVETIDSKIEACKTRIRRVEETVVAAGAPDDAVIHIGIAVLPGRTPELKARLSEAVLDLVAGHLKAVDGMVPIVSAEVRDLEPSYRKR
ncbi:isomerase [Streptomyces lunaelactis]|uniref:Isomerase n=1 Tax=Streptomyces lunaelactis TaxID=1535768 RepID=A0A2R4T0J6_9ACTN|nr:5-carboxymethyl-2-hydroxymuconate Delta-isomerase [Streptomyces lunaelactis]AVZ72632.1 isomerase [Streptomyces lunaelactis]NUK89298.1 5-carboxymethyl-2-hydroxymuconate Delta-isomerase [Streptomyces lunaelactis]